MEIKLTDKNATYLGDGVYLFFDPINRIWICTYDGYNVTNQICLEPEVLQAFKNTVFPERQNESI